MRAIWAVVLLAAGVACAPPRVIIVALGDDYGFNNVGYPHGPLNAGNAEMRTPCLDELAMSGIRLDQADRVIAAYGPKFDDVRVAKETDGWLVVVASGRKAD